MADQPAAYRALLNATSGLVRAVVELHGPVDGGLGPSPWWECHGCEASGYDWEHPDWPCGTSGLIAEHVGVRLEEAHYAVDSSATTLSDTPHSGAKVVNLSGNPGPVPVLLGNFVEDQHSE